MSAPFNAVWLMEQVFPPIQYVVPGIIPEGTTLLVASPKIGKSWMVLGLGIELSNGGHAFGIIPVGKPRPVLYLALEDGHRRLQDRLTKLNPANVSHRLEYQTAIDEGKVIETIASYMHKHHGLDPVVILDTLGRVMPPSGNGNQYGHDYSVLSRLKATADAVPGSSLVIVHHTRKMDAGDFLDAVSGTQGLAGAADTVLLLQRERNEPRGTLKVTSRDAAEGEYSLLFPETCAWQLDGASLGEASAAAHTAKITAGLGDKSTEVIATIAEHPEGITPRDLKVLLPDIAPGTIDVYLKRAYKANRIAKTGRGRYTPVRTVRSVSTDDDQSDTSNTSYMPTGDHPSDALPDPIPLWEEHLDTPTEGATR